ncbi:MAG: hypothetical protein CK424_06175 [Legionella sp.]|nr:MAG: hypothetical protein CK424_06175 [Legionella sp.]
MYNPNDSLSNPVAITGDDLINYYTTDNVFQPIVDHMFPMDTWQCMASFAKDNDFNISDISAFKESSNNMILDVTRGLRETKNKYEQEISGYQLCELNFQIQFKNHITRTEITYIIHANASKKTIHFAQKPIEETTVIIDETSKVYPPEDIPGIIEKVRSSETSFNASDILKERLNNDPNWKGEDIEQMGTRTKKLSVFEITTSPILFFRPANQITDQSAEHAPPLEVSCKNKKREVAMYQERFFYTCQKTSQPSLTPQEQTNDLSMSGSTS